MWFRNWERVHLSYLIHMKSVYFDFSFGLAVDVIRISIQCGVDMQPWRSGGKNIILKAQFCLLTRTTILFLRREIRQLHKLLVPYSITRTIKKDIMISFVIVGKSMLAHHLPF